MGTSLKVSGFFNPLWDHPHACGDKYIKNMTEINPLGSSPRVWGQDIKNIWCSQIVRIIPMRVGTSCNVHIKQSQFWDHPHACGDKFAPFSAARRMSGSSPRVWGQVGNFFRCRVLERIIPTRVGTRGTGILCNRWRRDHPHACGDKCHCLRIHRMNQGSSPRVWGQAHLSFTARFISGIIPTRVGTSAENLTIVHGTPDHPHACGDKVYLRDNEAFLTGSSPRVWGQV